MDGDTSELTKVVEQVKETIKNKTEDEKTS